MTGSPPDPPVFPDLGKAAELLAAGELPVDPLLARRKLAGRVPDEVARAAIELADLRRRAAPKFRDPDSMWLTRKGLEQSTRLAVADWRASEVARLDPGARVWDRTAGLGADCLALARAGLVLVASELDPLHAACCRANLATAGVEAPVRCGDSLRQDEPCDLVVLDPDRRPASEIGEGGRPGGGRRRLDATAFAPPVRTWPTALGAGRGGWIKLPPGLDPAVLEAELAWRRDEMTGLVDEAGRFPRELYQKAGAVGLLGIGFPEAYGGIETDALGGLLIAEEVEEQAAIYWGTLAIGGPSLLSDDEMVRIADRFRSYGQKKK